MWNESYFGLAPPGGAVWASMDLNMAAAPRGLALAVENATHNKSRQAKNILSMYEMDQHDDNNV